MPDRLRLNPLRLFTRSAPTATRDLTARNLTLRAESLNEDARTVDAVLATERVVEVYDWRRGEAIDETLSMAGAEAPELIPLLDSHNRFELKDHLGSVRDIRTEDGRMVGTLRLADDGPNGPATRALALIRDGHLRTVSIGYQPVGYEDIEPGKSRSVNGRLYTADDRVLRVTSRWALRELSLVSIPADDAAQLRNIPTPSTPDPAGATRTTPETATMNPHLLAYLRSLMGNPRATETEAQAYYDGLAQDAAERAIADALATPATDTTPTPSTDDATDTRRAAVDTPAGAVANAQPSAADAVAAERQRVRDIRALAGEDVPDEVITGAIDNGDTVDQARTAVLAAVRGNRRSLQSGPGGAPGFIPSLASRDADQRRDAVAAGLMLSLGYQPDQFVEPTRSGHRRRLQDERANRAAELGDAFRNTSIMRLAEECVRFSGGSLASLGHEEVWRAAIGSADLQYAFTSSVNAGIEANYQVEAGDTSWCSEMRLNDFKQHEMITPGKSSGMSRLPRGGSAGFITTGDNQETIRGYRYASQFGFDDQDAIDDRQDILLEMPGIMSEEASLIRPRLVWYTVLSNPNLNDGGALFNNNPVTPTGNGHANLTVAPLSPEAIKAGIVAMRKQRIKGQPILPRVKHLMVPIDLDDPAREYVQSRQILIDGNTSGVVRGDRNTLADVGLNIVSTDYLGEAGVVDPVTDTEITGSATNWFLAGERRTVRVGYVRGQRTPTTSQKVTMGPDRYGFDFGTKLDVGVAAEDFRSMHKSTGAG
ncbi:MAG: hypothetical protein AAGI54_04160 [Planctomycetota bacterium]